MRRILIVCILLLSGCQNISGPFQPRSPVRVDDPGLNIDEQERLSRDRLALPDESIAPPSGAAARPGSIRTPYNVN